MQLDTAAREELIKKYQWAGKVRFICFSILFLFLLAMKAVGGYSYLNSAIISLILVEALLNRPYLFFINKVDLYRFQFYQMMTDIIAISWVIYYLGGIEAPVVNLAYYVVILWAGVVSDDLAVFFAVMSSAVLFSAVVILPYFGILPRVSFFDYKMPPMQLFSLLLGNIAFLFAFGYFSARSSKITRLLERKKQEEQLRHTHKFLAAGTLVGAIAHDIVNYLITVRAYANVLLEKAESGAANLPDQDKAVIGLRRIEEAGKNSSQLLAKLLQFSRKPKEKILPADLHKIVDDAIELTGPMMKMADVNAVRSYTPNLPFVAVDKDEIQEVFVALILNSIDAINKKGTITIKTDRTLEGFVQVIFSDTGSGIKREDLDKIGEPFYTTKTPDKGVGMGLAIAYEVIARHKGKISVQSTIGKGTTFTIYLPVAALNTTKQPVPTK